MASPLRVLIVEDDPMAAAGLQALLGMDADIEVVGRCADGTEVAAALRETRPDVVLCDVRMPRMDGLAVVAAHRGGDAAFLMMTAFDDEGVVLRAVEAGAAGFLLKDDEPRRILAAVRSVAAGEVEFSPRAAKQLAVWVRDDPRVEARREAERRLALLTDRERQLAVAVVDGASDTELAERFFIGVTTVKSILADVRTKWGIATRTEIAVTVVRAGAA